MSKHPNSFTPLSMCYKFFFLLLTIWLLVPSKGEGQSDELRQQLKASGVLHTPLPLDRSHSLEAREADKQVLRSWSLHQTLVLKGTATTGRRARGSADDPDYAIYGQLSGTIDLHGADLRPYNRISLNITPNCDGARIVNMNLVVRDASPSTLGAHLFNLRNHVCNKVYLEIGDLPRERVSGLYFYTDLKGRDTATGDSLRYTIDHITLEAIADEEQVSGWMPRQGRMAYSMSGYLPESRKTALLSAADAGHEFELIDDGGAVVCRGLTGKVTTTIGTFGVADFSQVCTPGRYRLRICGAVTPPFTIGHDAFTDSEWRVLNYIFCQRCGYAVPGIHGRCHLDLFADHAGHSLSYGGGWHDAGDLSQQTLQSGLTTYTLLEATEAARRKNDTLLAARLEEEALWGIDFLLRTRFGDGYRASSMGLLHWTDGMVGTFDDIHTVRVQDVAFDNFLYAAYLAYASRVVSDASLRPRLLAVAKADFCAAWTKYCREGIGRFPFMMEHSYNTSPSQYHATVSWAASQLYLSTGEDTLAAIARDEMEHVLACQAQSDAPLQGGFFYRDSTRRSIVHFIHQSREEVYMQALTLLCQSQHHHTSLPRWMQAVRRYADYLKAAAWYTAPYYMLPSGVYQEREYADTTGFHALHLFAPPDAIQRYDAQLRQGVRLGEGLYLRRFPIWFGIFNGNESVLLSSAKAAALCGRFLGDADLQQLAADQLYWTVGRNPFSQSLIYGEGHDYPSMDSFSSGEITGAMPVGIRSLGDADLPYWPQVNNACYKEVWVSVAAKWLSLLAEID